MEELTKEKLQYAPEEVAGEKKENPLQGIMENQDFQKMYAKMHTPWHRRGPKIGRNETCPFCDSGKKFKKCGCYEKYKNTPQYTINY